MRPVYFACACLASAFLLEACSGGSSAVPRSIAASSSSSQAGVAPDVCPASRIYVGDFAKADVEIYPQGVSNPSPCGKIKTGISGPEALYVDTKGKLYVANFGTSTVTEYPHGRKTPNLTITTAAPGFDLFVGKDKTLYVAEANANKVEEFAPAATTPFLTLSIGGGPHGVATDSHNNLYVSYLSDSDGVSHVEKFAPKASTGTDLGFTVGFSGEVKLDAQNDIIIGDRNASIVYIYPPGQTVPSRSFSTAGGKPVNFALSNDETHFYVSGFFAVAVMDYASGTQVDGISTGLTSPSGVALFPPAPY
jgi:hypothetical protein